MSGEDAGTSGGSASGAGAGASDTLNNTADNDSTDEDVPSDTSGFSGRGTGSEFLSEAPDTSFSSCREGRPPRRAAAIVASEVAYVSSVCENCGIPVNDLTKKKHDLEYHSGDLYSCPIHQCGASFRLLKQLTNHYQEAHQDSATQLMDEVQHLMPMTKSAKRRQRRKAAAAQKKNEDKRQIDSEETQEKETAEKAANMDLNNNYDLSGRDHHQQEVQQHRQSVLVETNQALLSQGINMIPLSGPPIPAQFQFQSSLAASSEAEMTLVEAVPATTTIPIEELHQTYASSPPVFQSLQPAAVEGMQSAPVPLHSVPFESVSSEPVSSVPLSIDQDLSRLALGHQKNNHSQQQQQNVEHHEAAPLQSQHISSTSSPPPLPEGASMQLFREMAPTIFSLCGLVPFFVRYTPKLAKIYNQQGFRPLIFNLNPAEVAAVSAGGIAVTDFHPQSSSGGVLSSFQRIEPVLAEPSETVASVAHFHNFQAFPNKQFISSHFPQPSSPMPLVAPQQQNEQLCQRSALSTLPLALQTLTELRQSAQAQLEETVFFQTDISLQDTDSDDEESPSVSTTSFLSESTSSVSSTNIDENRNRGGENSIGGGGQLNNGAIFSSMNADNSQQDQTSESAPSSQQQSSNQQNGTNASNASNGHNNNNSQEHNGSTNSNTNTTTTTTSSSSLNTSNTLASTPSTSAPASQSSPNIAFQTQLAAQALLSLALDSSLPSSSTRPYSPSLANQSDHRAPPSPKQTLPPPENSSVSEQSSSETAPQQPPPSPPLPAPVPVLKEIETAGTDIEMSVAEEAILPSTSSASAPASTSQEEDETASVPPPAPQFTPLPPVNALSCVTFFCPHCHRVLSLPGAEAETAHRAAHQYKPSSDLKPIYFERNSGRTGRGSGGASEGGVHLAAKRDHLGHAVLRARRGRGVATSVGEGSGRADGGNEENNQSVELSFSPPFSRLMTRQMKTQELKNKEEEDLRQARMIRGGNPADADANSVGQEINGQDEEEDEMQAEDAEGDEGDEHPEDAMEE